MAFQHLFDNLGLLNQEGSDNSISHTVSATGTAVWSLDGLDSFRYSGVPYRSESGNTGETRVTVTTFWGGSLLVKSKVGKFAPGSFDDSSHVRAGVVRLPGAKGDSLNHLV